MTNRRNIEAAPPGPTCLSIKKLSVKILQNSPRGVNTTNLLPTANLFLLISSIMGSKTAGPHTQFVQSFIEECVECLEQGSHGSILQFMPFTLVS